MIELRLYSLRLRLDFSFLAVLLLFLLLDQTGFGIMGLYACLIHELGHLFAMLIVGSRPDIITLYGAGLKITSFESYKLPIRKEMAVLLSGSLINLFCFALFYLSSNDLRLQIFAAVHLIIGVFNLLPLQGFDGERILSAAMEQGMDIVKAQRVTRIITGTAAISLLVGAVVLYLRETVNFTLVVTLAYFTLATFLCPKH